jgi:hypothetical protein
MFWFVWFGIHLSGKGSKDVFTVPQSLIANQHRSEYECTWICFGLIGFDATYHVLLPS